MGQPVSPVRSKVLVIDDEQSVHEGYSAILGAHVELLHALTLDEGDALFLMHKDLAAIVFDGQLGGNSTIVDTCDLVRRVRTARPNLLLIASSSSLNSMLMDAGCSKATSKDNVPRLLISLLNIPLE